MAKKTDTRELYAVDDEIDIDDMPKKRRIHKKILFLVAVIVALAAAAIAYSLTTREKNIVVDTYRVGLDTVSSITSVVGERKLKEVVRYDLDGISKIEYLYEADDQTETDLETYCTYLTDELGFAKMDVSDSSTTEGTTDATGTTEATEGTTVEQYGIASKEEGMVFTIEIAQQQDQYAITVSKEEGKDPNAEPLTEFNRNDALAYFESNIEKYVDLPKPISEYEMIFDVGQSYINGEDCYGITVYDKNSVDTNQYVEKYYIALATQNIYVYDNMTRQCTLIHGTQTTQNQNNNQNQDQNQNQNQSQGEITVGEPNPTSETKEETNEIK